MPPTYDTAQLYNCRTDYSPIQPNEYTGLVLGGCVNEAKDDLADTHMDRDTFILGGRSAIASDFFTVYGKTPHGDVEAVTDINDARLAFSVAAALGRNHGLAVEISERF